MFDPTKCESVSMAQAKAQEEQNPVSAALRATSIAFVTLAESGQIDDTTATENVTQFAPWAYRAAGVPDPFGLWRIGHRDRLLFQ